MLKLLFRGSASQFLAFAIDLVTALFLMPFLIHSLGTRGYGIWAIIGTIMGQLGLLDLGLSSTTQRYIANALGRSARDDLAAIYTTSILLFIMIGAVAMLIVTAILPFGSVWFSDPAEIFDFRWALVIAGLNLAIHVPFSALSGALLAKMRIDAVVSCSIAATVIRVGLTYLAVIAGFGIIGVAAAVLTATIVMCVGLAVFKRRLAPEIEFRLAATSRAKIKELLHFSKYVLFIRIGDAMRYRVDNLLIAPMLGLAAVTHYAVAVRLSDCFQGLVLRIISLPGPIFAMHHGRGEVEELRQKYLLVSEVCAALCGICLGGVLLFGGQFIYIWLGPGFEDSHHAIIALTIGMFFALLQAPSRDVLGAIYKHPFDAKSNAVEAIVNVGLTLLLIPRFGILGAALGTAFPMIVNKGFVLPVYICRQIGLPIRQYVRCLARPLAASALAAGMGHVLIPMHALDHLFSIVVAGGGYAGGAAALVLPALSARCRMLLLSGVRQMVQSKVPTKTGSE